MATAGPCCLALPLMPALLATSCLLLVATPFATGGGGATEPPPCPEPGAPCVAQRWAEAAADSSAPPHVLTQTSFIFTILHVLHTEAVAPAWVPTGEIVIHVIGASADRERNFLERFGQLCEAELLPRVRSVHVVLAGPELEKAQHGQTVTVGQSAHTDCEVQVSMYAGVYSSAVGATFPAASRPDVVVGFNVDAYSCSFRPTVQHLLSREHVPTFFSFYHPHEPRWLLETLADPHLAFVRRSRSPLFTHCSDTLVGVGIRGPARRRAARPRCVTSPTTTAAPSRGGRNSRRCGSLSCPPGRRSMRRQGRWSCCCRWRRASRTMHAPASPPFLPPPAHS